MERTKVVLAQPKSKSLRTTIPVGIARQFGIDEGSELGWDIQARDNKLVIMVVPMPIGTAAEASRASRAEKPSRRPKAQNQK